MPGPLPQLRLTWKKLLTEGKWSALFEGLTSRLQGSPANTLFLLRAQHREVYQQQMEGTISSENGRVRIAQISRSLLQLIDGLTEADLHDGQTPVTENPLDALLRQLPIHIPLTPLYLVNCNRIRSLRFFRRSFGRRQEECCRFQFYYILACPTQEPEGFAERLVYELMGEQADSHHHSVNYRRGDGDGRVRIEPCP